MNQNQKNIRILVAVAMIIIATLVCFNAMADEYRPKSVLKALQLNARVKTLYVGSGGGVDNVQLTANQEASKAAEAQGTWSSSNRKVVVVDGQGRLTALKPGKALISYTCALNGRKQRATCKIVVKGVVPTSVSFDKPRSVIGAGARFSLKANVSPANAYNKKVVYRSSNPSVATVSQAGVVVGKKPGKVTITCQTASGKRKTSVKITVERDFSGIKYRLFAIGNASYQGDNKLPGCKNDLKMVQAAFANASFSGKKAEITAKLNLTGAEIRRMLAAMADSGATSKDVTVFYYSGHGMNGGGYDGALCGTDWDMVSVKEVQRYLDKVPGKVVVILDCCLSGQYIGKNGAAKAVSVDAKAFNASVVAAFSNAAKAKALTDSAQKNKYKILTASGPKQASYISNDRDDACSVFTDYLAQAMGEDLLNGELMRMDADANTDRVVTLNELYRYVDARVKAYLKRYPAYKQTTMVWPKGDSFPVIARN